jgi:hypothetical protein
VSILPHWDASREPVLTHAFDRLGLASSKYLLLTGTYRLLRRRSFLASAMRDRCAWRYSFTYTRCARSIFPTCARCLGCLLSCLLLLIISPFIFAAWVFVVLGDSYDLEKHAWNPDGIRVLRQQDFWFAFGMTVL